MDPISMIIAALSAGAVAASKDTAEKAVRDTYEGLKTLIKKRFADQGKEDDSNIIDKYEKKLESPAFKELLKEELTNLSAQQDDKIIELAKKLLNQGEAEEPTASKYNTVFQGEVKGAQIGDDNTQNNTFT
ncbi:hypothetical protein [Umezakia ovalisporum]|jgi:peroxiredoxin family protein|nr:hypothetical protein [Umezakia ovalisporum]MBI1240519.1 hypothetical protein [Nostoc sp. RI_552]MDH6058284.1 hypothetical protein [Umezakia ovalisporum FSS-43]MDH6072862.1 hypothetical protein [Umezakia ovalisporum CS-1034]MDH6076517.1 hypothetical protein [Umezakia ovalisporum FSS-45]MDH6095057.1 hypothetical protein [Umezakia ovalisporum CobakiLakeB]